MPTIKQSLYFNYDGLNSEDFGLIHVNLDGGMFEEQFVASRDIIETKIRGNDTPLFHSVDESPLQFDMTIAFEKPFTNQDIDDVILWLFKDTYRPLYFEDSPDRIYHCMPVGDAKIFHNGLKEGYITITMRNKSSKVVSPLITTQLYDLSTNAGTYNLTINNTGHLEIFPEISIEKVDAGHLTFTKNGEIFEVRDLTNGEKIYINTEKEIIETDIIGTYRYENVVGDYHDMALSVGNNIIGIQGKCKVRFRYTLKYRF